MKRNNKSIEIIKVGSRSSRLAQVQVKEVFKILAKKGISVTPQSVFFETRGDIDQTTSLTTNPADDFFTDTLDEALLTGEVDVTIHSAKDLPKILREGLCIFALTETLDDRDAFIGRAKLAKLPPGAKVGTSSLVRHQEVLRLNPQVQAIDIRGNIDGRIKQFKDGKYDGIIVAACALKRLGLQKEITEVLPWEGMPLQGQLAVVGRAQDKELRKVFSAMDVRQKYGKVVLVGAGPGDPDLISVKGVKTLKKADCIFYDYLAHPNLLDYAPQAEKIYVGKRKGEHSLSQRELCRQIKAQAMAGKNVVRLKGGDPLVFGRGAEEIEYLRSYHIDVEIVPGITSATGIPSSLGLPLTARQISSSVALVSGHGEAEDAASVGDINIPQADTLIFFMGLTKLAVIVRSLRNAGWPADSAIMVIAKGTMVDEKIVAGTLQDIEQKVAEDKVAPPALIVAGPTVEFWQQHTKQKECVLYLGTNPEKYKSLGQIIPFPMIEITPVKLARAMARELKTNIEKIDIILLTSRFAVRYFFEFVRREKLFDRVLGVPFAAIGEDTAYLLEQYGITPRVVAKDETSQGMLKALKNSFPLKREKILFPRSSLSNPYLLKELTKRGCKVQELVIYKNTKPAKRELPSVSIEKVVFTSPSTVRNFLEDYGVIPPEWQILSKGTRTQEELRQSGYTSEIVVLE